MNKLFTESAWDDYLFWQKHDKQKLQKIHSLLKAIEREPFKGDGKPEPLKHDLAGKWSRRIDQEHRIIYEVKENNLILYSCRFHY